MSHAHSVVDQDAHFMIDGKTAKVQFDSVKTITHKSHNSERVTFQMPRYVEGHDMLSCNSVKIHYTNINSATKEEVNDQYEVVDLDLLDEETIKFSWLVSRRVTGYVGKVYFGINFSCIDEKGNVEYLWPTQRCTAIKIVRGVDNSEVITEEYPDILEQMKLEVIAVVSGGAPKQNSITLLASGWSGTESPYSQTIDLNNITSNSKVDLQPTPEQLEELIDNDISLTTINDDGVVTVYAIGDKPNNDMTMQVLITEVIVS